MDLYKMKNLVLTDIFPGIKDMDEGKRETNDAEIDNEDRAVEKHWEFAIQMEDSILEEETCQGERLKSEKDEEDEATRLPNTQAPFG